MLLGQEYHENVYILHAESAHCNLWVMLLGNNELTCHSHASLAPSCQTAQASSHIRPSAMQLQFSSSLSPSAFQLTTHNTQMFICSQLCWDMLAVKDFAMKSSDNGNFNCKIMILSQHHITFVLTVSSWYGGQMALVIGWWHSTAHLTQN